MNLQIISWHMTDHSPKISCEQTRQTDKEIGVKTFCDWDKRGD